MHAKIRIAAILALMVPAAAAAQDQQERQQPGQDRPANEAVAPEVTVQQPAPDVTVRQPTPDVTVRQARPDVDIEAARPEVDIQTGEPEVEVLEAQGDVPTTIDRATPNVEIRQARPVVNIEAGEPEVLVEQDKSEPKITIQKVGRRDQAAAVGGDAMSLAAVDGREGQRFIGMEVIDIEDDEVGEVRDVLLTADGTIDMLIVETDGGFLGAGERLVAIPVDQAQLDPQQGGFRVNMSEDRVEEMAEFRYENEQRQALVGPGDR